VSAELGSSEPLPVVGLLHYAVGMTHLRFGAYNVQRGHPTTQHANMILRRFEDLRLDVLALTEVADYVHALDRMARAAGHSLIYITGPENVINQALLVRHGLEVGRYHSVPMPATYFSTDGQLRRSEDPLVVHVGKPGEEKMVFVVVHAPVGAWTPGKGGRHFLGPVRRRIAFHRYVKRLRLIASRHRNSLLCFLGDWNTTPEALGFNSAARLAKRIGGRIIHPGVSTGHGEIDFAVIRNLHGSIHTVPNDPALPHSDHLLVVGILTSRA